MSWENAQYSCITPLALGAPASSTLQHTTPALRTLAQRTARYQHSAHAWSVIETFSGTEGQSQLHQCCSARRAPIGAQQMNHSVAVSQLSCSASMHSHQAPRDPLCQINPLTQQQRPEKRPDGSLFWSVTGSADFFGRDCYLYTLNLDLRVMGMKVEVSLHQ
jgi:hypothetical protein